jgi:hypothetical protein
MQHFTDIHAVNSRVLQIIEELERTRHPYSDSVLDPAFDTVTDDLEREFAELRCLNSAFDGR